MLEIYINDDPLLVSNQSGHSTTEDQTWWRQGPSKIFMSLLKLFIVYIHRKSLYPCTNYFGPIKKIMFYKRQTVQE